MRKTSVLLMIASDLYFSKLPQTSNYQSLIESLLLMIYNLTLVTGEREINTSGELLSMIYNLMLVTGLLTITKAAFSLLMIYNLMLVTGATV